MTAREPGWDWFDRTLDKHGERTAGLDHLSAEITRAFVRCFSTRDGQRVLRHLRRMTLDRVLGPSAPDAMLRHLEGQRQIVAHILALVRHGTDRACPMASDPTGNLEDTEIEG